MNRKLKKLESTYWRISKIVGILFTLINYQMWTSPLHILKAVFIILGVSVGAFAAINIIDLCVGIVAGIVKHINRKFKDKRLLKGFCQTGAIGENE